MKLLIVDNFHHKNMKGLEMICRHLNWNYTYKYGNISEIENEIPNYDVIYFPVRPYDPLRYPNKRFIFGPHFSVFPDNRLYIINNRFNNSIYIQPSEWAAKTWIDMNVSRVLPVKTFAFPVDTETFKPSIHSSLRDKVFIYFKARDPNELKFVEKTLLKLNTNNIVEYKVFDYRKRYNEDDYLSWLKKCKYGIWIGCHESQGFALEEALSCDVPLLVWSVTSMKQENSKIKYNDISATTIPYWDDRCGEFFTKKSEFEKTYNTFLNNLDTYNPREYILENLNDDACSKILYNLITE